MSEDVLVRLLDKVEHRFFGKYTAFVKDNADPENRGRLRLNIPSVLGPDVISGWALPCAPFGGAAGQGFFFIPDQDAGVWVEFEAGNPDYPIWVGTFWSKPGGTTEVPSPANNQSPPTSKIIATQKHIIELADEDGSESITITENYSADKNNVVKLDGNGISITDSNGNVISLTSAGVDIKDTDSNGNEITFAAAGTTIKSSKIKIGEGAQFKLVLGDTLLQLLNTFFNQIATHTHPTAALGPPSPATPPLVPPVLDGALSQKHMVE
jgi:uncharacterized protein involved in type VI secretion and phage assembly